MKLDLIPEPHSVKYTGSSFRMPLSCTINIEQSSLLDAAGEISSCFPGTVINVGSTNLDGVISIRLENKTRIGEYRLFIRKQGILLEAASTVAAVNGARTLVQVLQQMQDGTLPCVVINDWPDIEERGVYYDVCRGRVPRLEYLMEMASLLASHKINQLQLYIEHTFLFKGHSEISRGSSPLTSSDILTLDAHCRKLNIELVPSLATFGHMSSMLKHPRYHELCEDLGTGTYVDPEKKWNRIAFSLSPANPGIYDFLDSLFAEFLPLFSSRRFNVCCDETWDLGWGQSHALCKKKGKGRVYLDHIVKLNKLSRKYGKKIMFWGDIIRKYPELIDKIPGDATVLDWGYNSDWNFNAIRDFTSTGLASFVCPSVSGYVSLFPRLHESRANISGFAKAAVKYHAKGLLNTDWGDGGHYNFMEYSWYGYLFGAEQAWNCRADISTFTRRFCSLFLNIKSAEFSRALDLLGDITHLHCDGYYQSIWQWIYFAPADDPVLTPGRVQAAISRCGKIVTKQISINADLGIRTIRKLEKIRAVFRTAEKSRGSDPHGVLPYWIFAVDTLIHAARKLSVLGTGGKNSPASRQILKREMKGLMKRFEKLWMARNRRSEIRITMKRYRKAIKSLHESKEPRGKRKRSQKKT